MRRERGPRGSGRGRMSVSAVFDGSSRGEIAEARAVARSLMADVQAVHGLPVSARALETVQLVVSELVTNARKYAPGPCLLTLEIDGGGVEVTVWDSNPVLPAGLPADPSRVGQHGLEIVMALCRSFELHPEPVGKQVKAAVVLSDDPGGAAIHPIG